MPSKNIAFNAVVTLVIGISTVLGATGVMDDSDFEKMGSPKPGDWLYHFHEAGQSFEDYVGSNPVRATGGRHVLVFQPVGLFSPAEKNIVKEAVLFAGVWFDLSTRLELPAALPEKGWHRLRQFPWQEKPVRQYQTRYFLDKFLPKRFPQDGVCYLAITTVDLYPDEDWNFVFGQASLSERIGVFSMARYFPWFWNEKESEQSRTLAMKRSCKVLVHEVGHIFGLQHCIYYRCAMNGSNSLEESDRRPLRLCPICLDKLQWNRGFDIVGRYEKLKKFFEEHDLNTEAAWITNRLNKMGPILKSR